MSSPSRSLPFERVATENRTTGIATLRRTLVAPVRAAAFWAAVCLPPIQLSLLATGLDGGDAALFGALLLANVVALVLGRDYKRE